MSHLARGPRRGIASKANTVGSPKESAVIRAAV
jgi:hypothetical protein